MKKRIRCFVFAVAIIICTCITIVCRAENAEVIIAGETVVTDLKVGGTVTVPVKILKTPGLAVAQVNVNWDSSVLKLVGVDYVTMENNFSAPINNPQGNYIVSMGDYVATENNIQTGVMFELEFEILPTALVGEYTVELSQGSDAFIDKDMGIYTAALDNGSVMLKGDSAAQVPVTPGESKPISKPESKPESAPTAPPTTSETLDGTIEDIPDVNPFADVAAGVYYYDAVQWAVNNGITTGTGNGTFSPDTICTRAQVVTFLWRAAGCPAPKSIAMPFTDVTYGSYHYAAVLWAVENGITNGISSTTFGSDVDCTRGQIVTFLWRTQGAEKVTANNLFVDVADQAYYNDAVLWAVANGVTNGTGAYTFSPDQDCTRAQVVTFLWRCLEE